jgi:hypothetical protein
MDTFELFHDAAFGAGVSVDLTTGPVLSSVYEPWTVADWPVHLPCLFMSEAAAVTAFTPSPAVAVVVKVHVDFGVVDSWWAVKAPATSTQCVSDEVVTVSVSAWPCLAYTVPPAETVPAPEKTALLTLAAEAVGAFTNPVTARAAVAGRTTPARHARAQRSTERFARLIELEECGDADINVLRLSTETQARRRCSKPKGAATPIPPVRRSTE